MKSFIAFVCQITVVRIFRTDTRDSKHNFDILWMKNRCTSSIYIYIYMCDS